MSENITEDRVHRIIREAIDTRDGVLSGRFDKQDTMIEETSDTIHAHTIQLEQVRSDIGQVNAKLGNIYGNGSGRKCILDRLEDKTDATDKKVENALVATASFRHEIRETLDAVRNQMFLMQNKEEERKEFRKDRYEWVKWVIGILCVIVWPVLFELIKIYWLKGK